MYLFIILSEQFLRSISDRWCKVQT